MKKEISIFLCLLLSLVMLAGCGGAPETTPSTSTTPEATPEPTIEMTPEPSIAPTPLPTPEPSIFENQTQTVGEITFTYTSIKEPLISEEDDALGFKIFTYYPAEDAVIRVGARQVEEKDSVELVRQGMIVLTLQQLGAGDALDEGIVDLNGISAEYGSYAIENGGRMSMYAYTSFVSDANIVYCIDYIGLSDEGLDAYLALLESIDID